MSRDERDHAAPGDLSGARGSRDEACSERELALREVIARAPFGAHLYRLDDASRLVLTGANPAADRILKIDHAPLVGKTIEEAFPALAGTPIPSAYRDVVLTGTTYAQEQVDYDEGGISGAFDITAFATSPCEMAVFFVDITDRKRVEQALRDSEERFRLVFENSTAGVALVALDGRYQMVNPAYSEIFGYSAAEFPGLGFLTITHPDDLELSRSVRLRVLEANGAPVRYAKRYLHKDGHTIWAENSSMLLRGADGAPACFITHVIDLTERKHATEEREKLQAELAQAQKMESVGRLAGGVAHDFNNMLGVILGHAELALEQIGPAHPIHADLEEIRKAAQRSADLTGQLLAFARRQTVAPRVLDLNETIGGMLKMLRRLIGEDIDLTCVPQEGLWPVTIDPTQLDQVLANLCVNARDAIQGVGKVTIRTKNVTLAEDYCAAVPGLAAGDYVALTVSDSGAGIEKSVLEHLFEPFYTTKGLGRGTGLGLAMVYGIVRQNEGLINVYSEPGIGTTFNIYLPRASGTPTTWAADAAPDAWRASGETALLVEDEAAMLALGRAMLERLGLRVLAAGSPAEALQLAEEHPGRIDLLITDVVMPGMNGRDLAARIGAVRPDLPCVFISGYTADVIVHRGVLDEDVRFLQKPFSVQDLSSKVRAALGGRS